MVTLFRTRLSLLLVLLVMLFLTACHSNPTAPTQFARSCKEHGIYPGGTVEAWTANCPVTSDQNGTWYGNPSDYVEVPYVTAGPNGVGKDYQVVRWVVYYKIEFDTLP